MNLNPLVLMNFREHHHSVRSSVISFPCVVSETLLSDARGEEIADFWSYVPPTTPSMNHYILNEELPVSAI